MLVTLASSDKEDDLKRLRRMLFVTSKRSAGYDREAAEFKSGDSGAGHIAAVARILLILITSLRVAGICNAQILSMQCIDLILRNFVSDVQAYNRRAYVPSLKA